MTVFEGSVSNACDFILLTIICCRRGNVSFCQTRIVTIVIIIKSDLCSQIACIQIVVQIANQDVLIVPCGHISQTCHYGKH